MTHTRSPIPKDINGLQVQGMVSHWIQTPINGYLGSNYGQDAKAMLQTPFAAGLADAFLQKLRRDVPILQALPAGATNLYAVQSAPDKQELVVEVAGQIVHIHSQLSR